uniref:Putative ovule protein n=1 Tax=Solanum chacoense TaxID=4108 RepID=A0A0V0HCA6_SOLCH
MPEHTSDLLSCWIRREGSKTQKQWWRVIPSCIWRTVWKERNGRCFEDRFNSMQKIKENCITNFHFGVKKEI